MTLCLTPPPTVGHHRAPSRSIYQVLDRELDFPHPGEAPTHSPFSARKRNWISIVYGLLSIIWIPWPNWKITKIVFWLEDKDKVLPPSGTLNFV